MPSNPIIESDAKCDCFFVVHVLSDLQVRRIGQLGHSIGPIANGLKIFCRRNTLGEFEKIADLLGEYFSHLCRRSEEDLLASVGLIEEMSDV